MRMTQFTMESLWVLFQMDVSIRLFSDSSQHILHIYPEEDSQLVSEQWFWRKFEIQFSTNELLTSMEWWTQGMLTAFKFIFQTQNEFEMKNYLLLFINARKNISDTTTYHSHTNICVDYSYRFMVYGIHVHCEFTETQLKINWNEFNNN